jgi:hypothetical protein
MSELGEKRDIKKSFAQKGSKELPEAGILDKIDDETFARSLANPILKTAYTN